MTNVLMQPSELTSGPAPAAPETAQDTGKNDLAFTVIFGKAKEDVTMPESTTVGRLKHTHTHTHTVSRGQWAPLVEVTKSTPAAAADAAGTEWDAKPEPSEPWCKQQPHMKILAKGKPEDAVPGISGKQVPLPEEVREIRGLLNSQGTKVRAVFKPEIEELTISSASAQQRVPYGSVKKIETQPIEGQEEYSIVSLPISEPWRIEEENQWSTCISTSSNR
ncbi:hypothetical protein DUNSADRAFT_2465 [Dunaliella salina]|uniref:UBFD1 PH-like C-terminal domain-containing protein n=1 Tax=Dunaliella salina TaxID=3046 RepID=A0ABQ7G8M9_DUNSA|nr:hypothetical protein DUNSADRAFT_2465 [Dunaliella salina]|eukprot:KAF5838630.1 hypothetical protein DUNSADRAFT_2465 [Dunaliella salina]